MYNIRRPQPGEDDLEMMAEQFEKDKRTASGTTVINKRSSSETEPTNQRKKPSIFGQQRKAVKEEDNKFELPPKPEIETEEPVLTDIVEKNMFGHIAVKAPQMLDTQLGSRHFPDILQGSSLIKEGSKKKSVFLQEFKEMKLKLGKETIKDQNRTKDVRVHSVDLTSLGSTSCVLTGDGLQEGKKGILEIHKQNLNTLQSMSEEELLDEQKKIATSMDPTLLNWIRTKRTLEDKTKFTSTNINETTSSPGVKNEKLPVSDIGPTFAQLVESDKLLLSEPMELNKPIELSKFPHMDQLEIDKLSWTGDLPPPVNPGLETGFSARFDFEGNLLPPDVDVSVNAGLHHHGEEAERAGYTVGEMLTLTRSTNTRQRVLGLQMFTRLFGKIWTGELDGCFHQNLLEELIGSGLVYILRVSLDSTEPGLVLAGAQCLASLVYNQYEESVLDWQLTTRQPKLSPAPGENDQEDLPQLTDHQLANKDLVLALIRMELTARINYLIESPSTASETIAALLAVLVRVARHSLGVADKVARSSLIKIIINSDVWDKQALAVKLIRVLAGWGRHLAHTLVLTYGLQQKLVKLLVLESEDKHQVQLCVEAHRTWAVFLSYGLCQQVWIDLHPVTLTRLVNVYQTLGDSGGELAGWLLVVCQQSIRLAGDMTANPPHIVGWDQLSGLRDVLVNCVTKWLGQLESRTELTPVNLGKIIGSAALCLGELFTQLSNYDQTDVVGFFDQLDEFYNSVLLKFFKSSHYHQSLSFLNSQEGSGYLSNMSSCSQPRRPACLPCVGAGLQGGGLHPILSNNSQVLLLQGVLQLTTCITNIHPKLGHMLLPLPSLVLYLSSISTRQLSLTSHWLSCSESLLIYNMLIIYHRHLSGLAHTTALTLASLLHTGYSGHLHHIFHNFLFNADLLTPDHISKCLSSLSLSSHVHLRPTSHQPIPSPPSVVQNSISHLPSLRDTYKKLLLPPIINKSPTETRTLNTRNAGETILPSDWPFYPLLSLYNSSEQDKSIPISTTEIQWSLAYLSLLPPTPPTAHYLRLCTVFLSPNSMFLSPQIHSLLYHHLVLILSHSPGPDLSLSLPGISSNLELYVSLLDQFSAESYGDQLFSCYLLPPITLHQPVSFRRTLWTEKSELLSLITLSPDQLPNSWTLNTFIFPVDEEPIALLTAYFKAVVERTLDKERNPLMWQIASSHIRLVITQTDKEVKKEFCNFKIFIQNELIRNPSIEHYFVDM